MPRYGTADDIWRYQPRLVELRGTMLVVHFRYVVIGLYLLLWPAVFLLLGLVPGLSMPFIVVWGSAGAAALDWQIARMIVADRGFRGLCDEWRHETGAWLTERRDAAHNVSRARAYRYTATRIRFRGNPHA